MAKSGPAFAAPRFGWAMALLVFGALVVASPSRAQHYHPNEMIMSDPVTGAAILGFDPVAYFLEGTPRPGLAKHQGNFGGKVWYFLSEANRQAFLDHPEAYAPELGGYDPVAAASGIPVAGNPSIHVLAGGKLYLFRNAANRTLFHGDPALAATAEKNWPEVKRGLSP